MASRPRVLLPDETDQLPTRVYLAAHVADGGPGIELRDWNGQPLTLAYSSVGALIDGCGPDQPWLLARSEELTDVVSQAADRAGVGGVGLLLDEFIPEELRGTGGGFAVDEARWEDAESPDWRLAWVASQRQEPGTSDARLELRTIDEGQVVMLAYTSADALRAGAGPYQPAVATPVGLLGDVRRRAGADTISLDNTIPYQLRRTSGGAV